MKLREHHLLSDLAALVTCGLLAGLVVAVAALPAAAVTGWTAKSAALSFENLPVELQAAPLPQKTVIQDSLGGYIASFYTENRQVVTLDKVPLVMQRAVVAAEDSRFYEHHGVDPKGIIRALVVNQQTGSSSQGASTLTMQYVRRMLVTQADSVEEQRAATEKDYGRKLREARFALALEERLSKDEILTRYLNIAYFGNNAYGVAAAAKAYFDKDVDKLTLAEASMLAGLVQAPSAYDPTKTDKTQATERRNYVLQRMVELDFVTQGEADAVKPQPIVVKPTKAPNNCANVPAYRKSFGFFCKWFEDWWLANPAMGATADERRDRLYTGGFTIRTSLDPKVQREVDRAVLSEPDVGKNQQFATGSVVVEPGTGRVKAMSINRDFGIDDSKNPRLSDGRTASYPVTSNPLLGGSDNSPGYQAGSTFKMFTMVAALEQGLPLSTAINSPYQVATKKREYSTDGATCERDGRLYYCPKNADKGMTGRHTMWSGFGSSVNTYFIQLEEQVTIKPVVEAAQKMGVKLREKPYSDQFKNKAEELIETNSLSFTLGTVQVTPLEMAAAYATVAARGVYCEPSPLTKVTDSTGKDVDWAKPQCKRVISAEVADAAADAAHCPLGRGDLASGPCSTGFGPTARSAGTGIDRPIAGKSGSTDNNQSSWFVGFTPNLAAASFIVNPDRPTVSVGWRANVAHRVFNKTMKAALEVGKVPVKSFVKPTSKYTTGITVRVPRVNGLSLTDAQAELRDAKFRTIVAEERVNSRYRAGTVAYTDPAGGSKASQNGLITIYVSNGVAPKPTPKKSASKSAEPDTASSTRPATTLPTRRPRIVVPPGD